MRADIDGAAWGIEAARAVQGGAPDCENKQVRGTSAGGVHGIDGFQGQTYPARGNQPARASSRRGRALLHGARAILDI